jgi:hypothetical protein
MNMNFSISPKRNFVPLTPPPIGGFHPNKTIEQQIIQNRNGPSVVSARTRSVQTFASFQNMIERVKPTGLPCGSCGGR